MHGVGNKPAYQLLKETAERNKASLSCSKFEKFGSGFRVTVHLNGYFGKNYTEQGNGNSHQASKHDAASKILHKIANLQGSLRPSSIRITSHEMSRFPGNEDVSPSKQIKLPLNPKITQQFNSDTCDFLSVTKERNMALEFKHFCDTKGFKQDEHFNFKEITYGEGEDTINFVQCEVQEFKTSGAAKKKSEARKIALVKQMNHWKSNQINSPVNRETLGLASRDWGPGHRSYTRVSSHGLEQSTMQHPENFGAGALPTTPTSKNGFYGFTPMGVELGDNIKMDFPANSTKTKASLTSSLNSMTLSDDPDIIVVESKISFNKNSILGNPKSSKVYKGHFENRPAAVKLIVPDAYHNNEIREINILKKIEHTNLVRYLASEKNGNDTYVAMHLADLGTLEEYLKDHKPLVNLRKQLLFDVGNGLQFLHIMAKIVHRDIKPSNVLIFSKPHSTEVEARLADFGISKELKSLRTTSTTRAFGTPGWMSPETYEAHFNGDGESSFKVRTSTDIFSYGMLLFYGMCGIHPFLENKNGSLQYIQLQPNICQKSEPFWENFGQNTADHNFHCIKHLLSMMLPKNPEARCDINAVLKHPFFWNSNKCLEFVRILANELKLKEYSAYKKSISEAYLEKYGKWDSKLSPSLRQFVANPNNNNSKKYEFHRLDKLIDFIRDKYEHREILKNELFSTPLFGSKFENYMNYFIKAFPELIIFLFEFFEDSKLELNTSLGDYY